MKKDEIFYTSSLTEQLQIRKLALQAAQDYYTPHSDATIVMHFDVLGFTPSFEG